MIDHMLVTGPGPHYSPLAELEIERRSAMLKPISCSLAGGQATTLDSVGTPIGTIQALSEPSASEITREIYLHAIPEEQRRSVESVERLAFGPKLDPSPGSGANMPRIVH